MQVNSYLLFVFVLTGMLVTTCQKIFAQSSEPKNIRDYFLILPDKYAGIAKAERPNYLSNASPVVDVANGYMAYQESAESKTAIALFKKSDKNYIVGISFFGTVINQKTEDIEDISTLSFLRYDNGKWVDMTRDVLPVAVNIALLYEGTTLIVTDGKGRSIIYSGKTANSLSNNRLVHMQTIRLRPLIFDSLFEFSRQQKTIKSRKPFLAL